jgi:hypothetical protein
MKTQINETKRMQQLAGILKEAIGDDIALKFSNTKPNTPPGATPGISPTSTVNTSDEKKVDRVIDLVPSVIQALGKIDGPLELDGLFKVIIGDTSLKNVPKSQIVAALNKALKELEPNGTTITTVKATK